jgi:signal recognition particle subunit SRP54
MFEDLSGRLEKIVKQVTGQGRMTEENIHESMREVRRALLEADVSVGVAKELVQRVEERAVGQEVLQSISPGQQVIKVVHEELTRLMGGRAVHLVESPKFPTIVLVVGLQGSGKTTFCGKLAHHLKGKKRRSLLVSADIHRPAAIEQLRQLAEANGLDFASSPAGTPPEEIAKNALHESRQRGFDYLIFDTAGRLHIDEEMMAEAKSLKEILKPHQVLLVVDGMSGRDAVNTAEVFCQELGVDGLVLSKMDGDARGGAALAIRSVTGTPVMFMGVGEKVEAVEVFHPERLASRVLGMGDVLTLIEKAQDKIDVEQTQKAAKKLARAEFTLEDFLDQMREVKKLGSLGDLVKMIPGAPKVSAEDVAGGEKEIKRVEAVIQSMTPQERRRPQVLNASRRKRIAAGSGTSVQAVNQVVRDFESMQRMMKRMGKKGRRKGLSAGFPSGFPGA